MSWLQVSIHSEKAKAVDIEQLLEAAGALSVTMTDAADQALLEPGPGETPLWDQVILTGLFPGDSERATLLSSISTQSGIDPTQIHLEELAEQEWTRTWLDHFRPMAFGQRLWVCPHDQEPPDAQAVVLRLDPGLAFGTGTHPTTALCLSWLDAQSLDRLKVLDYGCGSGILAIAATLLGATQAWAVDNDEQALIATRANAANNHVNELIHTYLPEALPEVVDADLCVANILAGPLCTLAPNLAHCTRAGGQIILSGILQEQADEVRTCYQTWFDMDDTQTKEGWVLLHGLRKA